MEETKVKLELVETNFFTRWNCHVCGGNTEKVAILVEVLEGEWKGFRVCETCVKERDFDRKLIMHAEELEGFASNLRSLVGRLEVPTLEQYDARCREYDEEWERDFQKSHGCTFKEWEKRETVESIGKEKIDTDNPDDSVF